MCTSPNWGSRPRPASWAKGRPPWFLWCGSSSICKGGFLMSWDGSVGRKKQPVLTVLATSANMRQGRL
eukprot:13760244-Heterocapsa_arctica.AAC.1